MPPKRKRTKTEKARQYLKGGGVNREDSDDELGIEDLPWEWIYSGEDERKDAQGTPSRKTKAGPSGSRKDIMGARMGSFECRLGDTVLLKAEGNEAWVGIICDFKEDAEEDEKVANFMWFSTPKEIRNKVKKRTDALHVCFKYERTLERC